MNEHVYKKPVELEPEGVYTLMYILKKKNYGGLFIRGDEVNPTLVIKGMQFKKRNVCLFLSFFTCSASIELYVFQHYIQKSNGNGLQWVCLF